ncbi:nuclear transport factor 2 family protein [Mycobacterium neglectum]|uniref:nuclear transport factor 2 family protein n=1 Tax=Mycobacterium neglectum TaxID=242737 RepID=UPI000BFF008C|nr:nuclear transport factor 2 family protein [Mycobacterium neglectum]
MTLPINVDEQAIRSLVHRYADAASRRDPAGVAGTFTADGVWHAPELGRFSGREAMHGFFTSMLDGWNVFLQALMSGVIVVDALNPDRAVGRWFVQENGQRAEGTNLIISGVYHDEYIRDGNAWSILHRRYDALMRNTDGQVTTRPFPTDVPAIN